MKNHLHKNGFHLYVTEDSGCLPTSLFIVTLLIVTLSYQYYFIMLLILASPLP